MRYLIIIFLFVSNFCFGQFSLTSQYEISSVADLKQNLTVFFEAQKRVDIDRNKSLTEADIALFVGAAYGYSIGEKDPEGNRVDNDQFRVFVKGYQRFFGLEKVMSGAFMEYDILNEEFRFGIPVMYVLGNKTAITLDLYGIPKGVVQSSARIGFKYMF